MTAFSSIINFNDRYCTTKYDVLYVLGKAIEAVEGKERRAREETQMRGRLRLLRHRLPAAPGQPVHVVVQRQVREREMQEAGR